MLKALVDDIGMNAIPHHEEQDGGVKVQHMVVTALESLQRISTDVVNILSAVIYDVNRRQSPPRAGGNMAGPKVVECGKLNAN